MLHAIGVLDRTGEITPLVEDLNARLDGQLEIHAVAHNGAIPADVRFSFLILGPREGSAAVLRRVRQYLETNPGTLALACGIAATQADKKQLLAHGVRHISRAKPSSKQLVKLLREAATELELMAQAAYVLDPSSAPANEDGVTLDIDALDGGVELTDEQVEQAEAVEELVEDLSELEDADETETDAVDNVDDELAALIEQAQTPVDLVASVEDSIDAAADAEAAAHHVEEDPEALAAMIPAPREPEERGIGQLVTVASATGGCGKTFFATNLALLAARAGKRCIIVDLDLQFGEVAIALRVSHPYSVYDGLYDGNGRRLPDEALGEHLEELTYHHKLGFDVLTAPRDPSLSDYVGARDASEILDVVMPLYDIVIVDTPPSLNEVVLVALDRSDVVAVMATLDVPSLKNLAIFLETLKRLSISDEHVRLVLNKTEADVGMKVSQAQEAFQNRFLAAIPLSRAVSRSINAGTVVCATEPRSAVSKRTEQVAIAMLPELANKTTSHISSSRVPWWRRWAKKGIPAQGGEMQAVIMEKVG